MPGATKVSQEQTLGTADAELIKVYALPVGPVPAAQW